MRFIELVIIILLAIASLGIQISTANHQQYSLIDGSLCINSQFVETYLNAVRKMPCAALCSRNQRCQAFSLVDGPCQLFVFDKCSKSVRDCSCSRRGQVFVKQQPGLLAGALCPSGYGMDLCGVKYRLYTGIGTWGPSRQKCESESGLVIMADVASSEEMSHIGMISSAHSFDYFWLGGYQPAGSPEPGGGWYWVGCYATVDAALWHSGQPNNAGAGNENSIVMAQGNTGVNDAPEDYADFPVLCECVSPFD